MNTYLMIVNIFAIALVVAAQLWALRMTRQDLLFGVRIPEDQVRHPAVVRLKRIYSSANLGSGVLMLLLQLWQFLSRPELTILFSLYFWIPMLALTLVVYVLCWQQARSLKTREAWTPAAPLTLDYRDRQHRICPYLPRVWLTLSLLICLIGLLLPVALWDTIPDPFPSHYDINMQVDGWTRKTWLNVMLLPLTNLGLWLIMLASLVIMLKQKLQEDPLRPAHSAAQHRVYRQRMGQAFGFLMLMMALMFLLLEILGLVPDIAGQVSGTLMNIIVYGLTIVGTVPLVVVGLRAGQGGSKLEVEPTTQDYAQVNRQEADIHLNIEEARLHQQRNDDNYWKLGLFYVNPDDDTLFVEDRFGNNSGLNYARPAAWIIPLLMAGLLIGLYVWLTPPLLELILA